MCLNELLSTNVRCVGNILQENPDEGDAQIVEKILGMRTVQKEVAKEVRRYA